MAADPAVAGPEHFDLSRTPAQPWKNGAGLTREIASRPDGRGGFDWRFSVAEVERDAPFSAFPGIDRCIVLLQGAGMRLRSSDGVLDHRLDRPNLPFHFPGDLPLAATLLGGPSRDLNVMTRSGAFRAQVVHHDGRAECASGAVTMLFCCQGEWQTDAGPEQALGAMQALLWREPRPPTRPIMVRPAPSAAAAHLMCISLHAC